MCKPALVLFLSLSIGGSSFFHKQGSATQTADDLIGAGHADWSSEGGHADWSSGEGHADWSSRGQHADWLSGGKQPDWSSATKQQDLKSSRVRRQIESLEYVLGVLQQRGLLAQVDPELISKAQHVIQSAKKQEGKSQSFEDQSAIDRDIFSASRERALNSRLGDGDHRSQDKTNDDIQPTPRRSFWEARREQHQHGQQSVRHIQGQHSALQNNKLRETDGECQALRTENQLLKQLLTQDSSSGAAAGNSLLRGSADLNSLLDTLKAQEGVGNPVTALKILQKLQGSESSVSPVFAVSPQDLVHGQKRGAVLPLDILHSQVEGAQPFHQQLGRLHRNIEGFGDIELEIRSQLISPTPTLSTIFQTSSFETTITENVTREIGIHFNGRKIITSIFETEVKVVSTSEVLTTTIEITPAPSWSTYTVTHTHTPRNALSSGSEKINPALLAMPFQGIRAQVVEIPESMDNVVSLQEVLRRLKEVKGTNQAAEPVVVPTPPDSISIMTVFLSGSKPGEFTTSLRTVTLGSGERRRRDVAPTTSLAILNTQGLELSDLVGQAEAGSESRDSKAEAGPESRDGQAEAGPESRDGPILLNDLLPNLDIQGSFLNPLQSLAQELQLVGTQLITHCPQTVTLTVTLTETNTKCGISSIVNVH